MSAVRASGLVTLIAMLVSVAACNSSDTRPDAATWEPEWESMLQVIPEESLLGDPPSEDLCQSTLATIREQTEGLFPTPSVTVDDLVNEWVAIAEEAFFDCPPEGQDIDSFADAYTEMLRLQEAVETSLADG